MKAADEADAIVGDAAVRHQVLPRLLFGDPDEVVAWIKAVLTLPFLVREWLVAETLEKAARRDEAVASALHHHSAAAGVALWQMPERLLGVA